MLAWDPNGNCTVSNGLTTHLAPRKVTWPYAQVPRRLGAGSTLTVLRFSVGTIAPGAGFLRLKERVSQVHSRESVNCRTRDNKLEEGDLQEA
jgi:hypothetical protein